MLLGEQPLDQMRSNKAGAAGDEKTHAQEVRSRACPRHSPYFVSVPTISSTAIARFLTASPPTTEVFVSRIVPLDSDSDAADAMTFAQGSVEARRPAVERSHARLMLLTPELAPFRTGPAIVVGNARLAIAKVARKFFCEPLPEGISPLASVHPKARIGPGAHVAAFVVIGPDVEIGAGAVLLEHVVIRGKVKIGDRVHVGPGAVIGADGFGIDFDEGVPVRIPQIGGVIIGNDVSLGAISTVCSGTFSPTIVEDEVKSDDHVHIAHNCHIKARSILTAGAVIGGSATLERESWIGPNASILNKGLVGKGTLVGLGAVVVKPTGDGVIVAGNPAKVLRKR